MEYPATGRAADMPAWSTQPQGEQLTCLEYPATGRATAGADMPGGGSENDIHTLAGGYNEEMRLSINMGHATCTHALPTFHHMHVQLKIYIGHAWPRYSELGLASL